MVVLLWSLGAWAACPSDNARLEPELDRLEAAPPGFLDAYSALRAELHCLGEPATPEVAAKWHRLRALAAFTRADDDAVLAAFRAAQAAQPGYVLPLAVAPEGHPLRGLYGRAAASDPAELVPVDLPRRSHLIVDGSGGAAVPVDRDALVQQVRGDTVFWTRTLPAGTPLPELVVPERRGGWAWWAGSGAAAVASAGLWAGALSHRAAVDRATEPLARSELDAVERHQKAGNALGYAAQPVTVAAVALAVVAVTW